MSVDPSTVLPQWATNLLTWFALTIVGAFTLVLGWILRKYMFKVDEHAERIGAFPATYATIDMIDEVEGKFDEIIPGLISRSEFMAYMQQQREDQIRMHKENIDNGNATRADIRSLHERVDNTIFKGR